MSAQLIQHPPATASTIPLILVAEDNAINRQTLVDFLELSDFRAIFASDGQQAVDQISSANPDLVLMDINMPNVDGIDAMRQVRASGNSVPIIALTGQTMVGDDLIALGAGANAYITKPVHLARLLRTIEHHLVA